MREMADADMLYNAEKQAQVTEIMLAHGYTAESVGECHHDVYMKPPVLNFTDTSSICQYHRLSSKVLRHDRKCRTSDGD